LPVPELWVEHSADTAIINANVARLDLKLAATPGVRDPFSLDLVRGWHSSIHEGTQHVPRAEYIGGFRGEGSLHLRNYGVAFGNNPATGGRFEGSPPLRVAHHLAEFEREMNLALAKWDALIPTMAAATLSRMNIVIQDVARLYASWIRIHPFADGNGRTARVLVNWLMVRYGQPLILPGRPVADRDRLVAATTPAVPASTEDVKPLVNHLRKRLKAARAAATSNTA